VLVDVLLVVGDEGLGDGLADGVDLGGVATAGDADADVDVGELVEADDEERLVDLEAEDLGLDEGERAAVNLDETAAGLFCGMLAMILLVNVTIWPDSMSLINFPRDSGGFFFKLHLSKNAIHLKGSGGRSNHHVCLLLTTLPSSKPRTTGSFRAIDRSALRFPPLTLHWATAVAVFFLPKHCTRWVVVDDMVAAGGVGGCC
jgi:hypothetical protein